MLLLLLVLLAGSLLGRYRFYLRCFNLSLLGRRRFYLRCLRLNLFGRRLRGRGFRGLGWLRVLVDVVVMAPERDFGEAAMVLLIFIFVGVVPASLGHGQHVEQQDAGHQSQGSSDCFAHNASQFRQLCSASRGLTSDDMG